MVDERDRGFIDTRSKFSLGGDVNNDGAVDLIVASSVGHIEWLENPMTLSPIVRTAPPDQTLRSTKNTSNSKSVAVIAPILLLTVFTFCILTCLAFSMSPS